jgi:hypothetical protein
VVTQVAQSWVAIAAEHRHRERDLGRGPRVTGAR